MRLSPVLGPGSDTPTVLLRESQGGWWASSFEPPDASVAALSCLWVPSSSSPSQAPSSSEQQRGCTSRRGGRGTGCWLWPPAVQLPGGPRAPRDSLLHEPLTALHHLPPLPVASPAAGALQAMRLLTIRFITSVPLLMFLFIPRGICSSSHTCTTTPASFSQGEEA